MPLLEVSTIVKMSAPFIKEMLIQATSKVTHEIGLNKVKNFDAHLDNLINSIDQIKTIWSPNESTSLRKFYYPLGLNFQNLKIRCDFIKNIHDKSFIIQGIVGQGKSIFLRHLALQELTSEKKRLPIFIEFRRLTNNLNLKKAIYQNLDSLGIQVTDQIFDEIANANAIVLLLDGFDELDTSIIKETLYEIDNLIKKYSDLQIVITSRPNNEIQKIASLKIFTLPFLTETDHEPFLSKLGVGAVKKHELLGAIASSSNDIKGVIVTPLMLTLLIFVYQSENSIPNDLPDFFENLFHTVFTRHDSLKESFTRTHHSGLSEKNILNLFSSFCFTTLQKNNKRTLSRSEFSECFDLAIDLTDNCTCNEEGFKKDITKVACLMLEEGISDVTFLHKSIAEYYSARFVKNAHDDFVIHFYNTMRENNFLSSSQWSETVIFLSQIDQYRFNKYYFLPEAQMAAQEIETLLNLIVSPQRASSEIPNFCQHVNVTLSKKYNTIATFSVKATEIQQTLSELIFSFVDFHKILSLINIPDFILTKIQADGGIITAHEDTFGVRLKTLLKYDVDFTEFHQNLTLKLNNIKESIEDKTNYVHRVENRKNIFSKSELNMLFKKR